MKEKNIAIMFGGRSTEHDISILSALQAYNAINKQKYNVLPIYISKSGKWFLIKDFSSTTPFKEFNEKKHRRVFLLNGDNTLYSDGVLRKKIASLDCALCVLHGFGGEDGTLQGVLETSFVPYTSGDILSLASTLDKARMKEVFKANSFPITDYIVLNSIEEMSKMKLDYPVIVKPNSLGSSIGIKVCRNKKELGCALAVAFQFDEKVVVERVVENLVEYNCAAYGYKQKVVLSKIERPLKEGEILSFEDKYVSKGKSKANSKREIPAKISKELESEIFNLTKKTFLAFNLSGVVRCDFLYDGEKLYINEVNSIPGSLANYLFDKPFSALIDNLIEIAIIKSKDKQSKTHTFSSSVL